MGRESFLGTTTDAAIEFLRRRAEDEGGGGSGFSSVESSMFSKENDSLGSERARERERIVLWRIKVKF